MHGVVADVGDPATERLPVDGEGEVGRDVAAGPVELELLRAVDVFGGDEGGGVVGEGGEEEALEMSEACLKMWSCGAKGSMVAVLAVGGIPQGRLFAEVVVEERRESVEDRA